MTRRNTAHRGILTRHPKAPRGRAPTKAQRAAFETISGPARSTPVLAPALKAPYPVDPYAPAPPLPVHPVQPADFTTGEIAILVKTLERHVTPSDQFMYRSFVSALRKLESALDQKEGRRVVHVP